MSEVERNGKNHKPKHRCSLIFCLFAGLTKVISLIPCVKELIPSE